MGFLALILPKCSHWWLKKVANYTAMQEISWTKNFWKTTTFFEDDKNSGKPQKISRTTKILEDDKIFRGRQKFSRTAKNSKDAKKNSKITKNFEDDTIFRGRQKIFEDGKKLQR